MSPSPLAENPNNFGQLADENGQGDAIQIAEADGLGEQVRDKAKTRQAGQDAQAPGEQGEHTGQRHQSIAIAGRQRNDRRGDDGGQRRIRAQHQDAAGPEDSVGDQRHDRSIQTVDRGQPGSFGVTHPDRNENGSEHQPGHDIFRQPGALVRPQRGQSWDPPAQALGWAGAHKRIGFLEFHLLVSPSIWTYFFYLEKMGEPVLRKPAHPG